jgi:biopolymer transport protein ExbD
MASIETGQVVTGKKAVDASITLIPFIDLLLCCVMFLLVTAVWNQLASIDAVQNTPGATSPDEPKSNEIELQVLLNAQGFVVSTTAGDSLAIPRVDGALDIAGLCERLDEYRKAYPDKRVINVAADDGIVFESVIATMDAVRSRGFSAITL